MRLHSSEKMLGKALGSGEFESTPEFEAALERLSKPLQEVEYQAQGSAEVSNEAFAISFSYSPLELEDQKEVHQDILFPELKDMHAIEEWKIIDSLTFRSDNKEIDLLSIGPRSFKLFFLLSKELQTGAMRLDKDVVYLMGDLSTPRAIATLLHEIGHLWDLTRLNDLGIEKLVDDHKYAGLAETLRKERDASAFALNVARPYLRGHDVLQKDVRTFLIGYALRSYYEKTKEDIGRQEYMESVYAKDWDPYAEEMEEKESERYDDFMRWKETEAYMQWRALPENKPLDEDEFGEYGAWVEWVKSTNYEYRKDFSEENK